MQKKQKTAKKINISDSELLLAINQIKEFVTLNLLTPFFSKGQMFFFFFAQKMLSGPFLLENMHHQFLHKHVET